ncbi:MAG TPA: CHAD domain-containing protein [Acidimicrobiales bacterium]
MTSETAAQRAPLTTSRPLDQASPHGRSLDDAGSLGYLVRQALSRSIAQIAQHEPGVRSGLDPEDVHQFRVGLRRLHSDLRTFAPLMRPRPRRGLGKELRWLGRAVGPVRDGDVLAKALEADARRLPRADPQEVALLSARLTTQNDSARAIMLGELESDRFGALSATLRDLAEMPPLRSKLVHLVGEPASEVAAEFVKKPWHELDTDVERLGTAPTDASLHGVRILVKRCRYAAEAVGPSVAGAAEFAKALASVQTVLGDHHDTVVAEAWLTDAVRDSPGLARLAYDLILRQRSKRARARAKWPTSWNRASAEELRTWL